MKSFFDRFRDITNGSTSSQGTQLRKELQRKQKEIERLRQERDMLKQQLTTLQGSFRKIDDQDQDELIPPEELMFIGKGDFRLVGHEFVQLFTGLAGLKPDESVLDVGCGVGRMAIALTKYLDKRGNYEGFDIVKDGIEWCRANVTPRNPNFNFQFADIFNQAYNPLGKYKASEYRFPYENERFDFVFLASVFTHMLYDDMDHYMSEISRVLKKNARCFITFFFLNQDSLRYMNENMSTINFAHTFPIGHSGETGMYYYRTSDEKTHESAVAYDERLIRSLYGKHRLEIVEPVRYGSWCGRKIFISYQDIIVAYKR
jgi:ubiquinone/menaquinone biosynthesis C-methylase UbiE